MLFRYFRLTVTFLAVWPVCAQFRAGIQGTVSDSSGAVIPGASVTLTSNETQKKQTTTSSGEGFYRFNGLAPGSYTVSASKQEFQTMSVENVRVTGDDIQGVNLTLQPGAMTQSVTVQGETTPALQTENANVDVQLTTQAVRDLPQIGRDPYNLLRLAPGVFGDSGRSAGGQSVALPNSNGPGGSNTSIFQTENQVPIVANGQRLSQNNFQIDGVSVNSLTWGGAAVLTPNQESIKSIRVSSSDYSAESGRNSGAQIDVISQNGTNQFHGSGVFKYDDPIFNAYNKFGGTNAPVVRVNDYQRQFAASIGGPVVKNHLFFFFSYEGLRDNSTNYQTSYVETPQYRQQVLSLRPNSMLAKVFQNPGIAPRVVTYLNAPCPSGFAPGTCQQVNGGLDIGSIGGTSGHYIDNGANPTGGGLDGVPDIAFAQIALPNRTSGNQYNGRMDYNLTTKDSLALSMYFTKLDTLSADAAGGARPLGDLANSPLNTAVTMTYNRILSATMLNEARFNLTRFASNQVTAASSTNFGIPRLEVEALPLPDRIRFGAPQSESTPAIFAQNQFEFRDNLRQVIGNHALSFGGQFRWEQDNNSLVGGARPDYSFQGLWNLANDTPVYEGINANPATGAPADAQRYFRDHDFGIFAQDDWKVRPGLTLNVGIRWEYFSPLTELRGRLTNLQFASPYTLVGAKLVSVGQLYNPDYKNFAPRLGFAWNPQKMNKLVVRGGFGMYYERIPDVLFANTRGNPPYFARYGICCGTVSSPFAGGQILYALGSSSSIYSYPANPALAVGIDPATGGVLGRTV
ncbi:MAG: TonB-dependent receptor, partial [Acidobacteriaceae bacterium]|nr:TonB-dependent receptor [Acidobacteriaceae bacterium]